MDEQKKQHLHSLIYYAYEALQAGQLRRAKSIYEQLGEDFCKGCPQASEQLMQKGIDLWEAIKKAEEKQNTVNTNSFLILEEGKCIQDLFHFSQVIGQIDELSWEYTLKNHGREIREWLSSSMQNPFLASLVSEETPKEVLKEFATKEALMTQFKKSI